MKRPLPVVLPRRAFLRGLFLGAAPVPAAAPAEAPPHALVVVFLRGAVDGLNTVVPFDDDDYRRLRPTLALPRPDPRAPAGATVLDLDGRFGLHPALAPLLPWWRDGRLGIVHAVGSDDTTRSHFEAQDRMEHGRAGEHPLSGGWIGRHLRGDGTHAPSALEAAVIGATVPESLRGAPSAGAFETLDEVRLRTRTGDEASLVRALTALHAGEGLLARSGRDTLELLRRVQELRTGEGGAAYPVDPFGRACREVGRLLRGDVGVRAACLDLGGFDTHFGQGGLGDGLAGGLAGPLRSLGGGLAALARDLGPRLEHTTIIAMTEFGRRAYENTALGTDHGSGSVMLLLGGGIRGGRVHGTWPGLAPDQLHEESDLRVTTDYRAVLAEVLERRCGRADVAPVFPGLPAGRPGVCR